MVKTQYIYEKSIYENICGKNVNSKFCKIFTGYVAPQILSHKIKCLKLEFKTE
jgi:hypothetical protein